MFVCLFFIFCKAMENLTFFTFLYFKFSNTDCVKHFNESYMKRKFKQIIIWWPKMLCELLKCIILYLCTTVKGIFTSCIQYSGLVGIKACWYKMVLKIIIKISFKINLLSSFQNTKKKGRILVPILHQPSNGLKNKESDRTEIFIKF